MKTCVIFNLFLFLFLNFNNLYASPLVNNLDQSNSANKTHSLKVGVYVQDIKNIEGEPSNTFDVDFQLWTIWEGDPKKNPSDKLVVLNADRNDASYPSNLNKVYTKEKNGAIYNLYKGHSTVTKRYNFSSYPFDSHRLFVNLGLDNYFEDIKYEVLTGKHSTSPTLYMESFNIQDFKMYNDVISYTTNFENPFLPKNKNYITQNSVSFYIDIKRIAGAFLAANFMGYFIGFILCVLILLYPSFSRDDLFLGAILVSSANYIYLIDILSITALNGFIGIITLIFFIGFVYVLFAEMVQRYLKVAVPHVEQYCYPWICLSYILLTFYAIYYYIPAGVI